MTIGNKIDICEAIASRKLSLYGEGFFEVGGKDFYLHEIESAIRYGLRHPEELKPKTKGMKLKSELDIIQNLRDRWRARLVKINDKLSDEDVAYYRGGIRALKDAIWLAKKLANKGKAK